LHTKSVYTAPLDPPGIKVDLVGDLGDIGEVYYCPKAAANILSFAAMTDAGADIRYDAKVGSFAMKPKGSENIHSFCRQNLKGSEGKLYVCDTRSMMAKNPTFHPDCEHSLVATV
jgi:hypothetical protein